MPEQPDEVSQSAPRSSQRCLHCTYFASSCSAASQSQPVFVIRKSPLRVCESHQTCALTPQGKSATVPLIDHQTGVPKQLASDTAGAVFKSSFCLRSGISVHPRVFVRNKRGVAAIRVDMVASDVATLPGAGRVVKPVVFTAPPNDKKQYRRVTLQNGLLAILISDPEMANQTEGGSELESEADMSEDEDGSEESDEVLINLPH